MKHRSPFRIAATALAAVLAGLHLSLAAQTVTERNPARRLPPTGSQATDIPAGVDTGSPTTTNNMPLGTPVPPALAPDRQDQNMRSAAARAAMRPATTPPATTAPAAPDRVAPGPAALGVQTDARDPAATLPRGQRPVARRRDAAGADCTSAPPAAASAAARGPSSRPC